MNKTTIIAVVAVLLLGAAAFFLTREPEREVIPGFSVPAIKVDSKTDAKTEEDEDVPKDAQEPIDKIVIARKSGETVLSKVDDETWKIGGADPSFAETYKVRSMLNAFKTGTSSTWAAHVKPEDLGKYGLDDENKIGVTLFRKDEKVVDILVGIVDKRDDGIEPDTTIMVPGTDLVYRMKEQDLRTPFTVKPEELRDKRLFTFKKDDILRLAMEDPRDSRYPKVVIEKAEAKAEAKPEAKAEDKPATEPKAEWKLAEPKGVAFELENVDGFASSIANVRATEFLSSLPGADSTALDKPYKLTVTAKAADGKETAVVLSIGAGRKKGVYASIEGRKEVFLIATYTADQLMKSLSDLRQKKLASFKPADVEGIELVRTDGRISLAKNAEDWSFVEPAGEVASAQKVKSLASNVANLRVAEYLAENPPDDQTGLSSPEIKLSVKLGQAAGGGTFNLLVGKAFKNKEEQERYYAKIDGTAEVFTIMKYTAQNVLKSVDDFKDMRMFRIEKDQIAELTIQHPDETLTFVQEAKDGKTTWKMATPKEKADVDLTAFLSTVASLDVAKIVDGKTPAEAGLTASEAFTVTFKLTDGTSHSVQISEEVSDNENYAQTTSEPWLAGKIVKVSKYKVDTINKKLPDFEKKPGPASPVPMPMM